MLFNLLVALLFTTDTAMMHRLARNQISVARGMRGIRGLGSVSTSKLMMSTAVSYDGKQKENTNKLDPSKTALLLIEYQNEFTTPGGKLHEAVKPCMDYSSMLDNSQELVLKARQKGVKIFHAAISFTDNYREIVSPYGILGNVKGGTCFVKQSWGSEFIETMKPEPEDIIVDGKRGLCTFGSTNLDFLLRHNGIENLVLAGFLTNCCVESTMRTGYEKGYKGTPTTLFIIVIPKYNTIDIFYF